MNESVTVNDSGVFFCLQGLTINTQTVIILPGKINKEDAYGNTEGN